MHNLKRNACTIQPERMHNDLRSACTFTAAYASKDISRPNRSFFRFHIRKNQENKGDWQEFFFTKREEKGENMLKNKGFWQGLN